LTKEEASYLFEQDLARATTDTNNMYADIWDQLSGPRQNVLINMMFNLGRGGLEGFVKMNQALIAQDYDEAANQMEDSKWYRQVKGRGKELVTQMRKG
jgi:lysozyme